MKLLDYAKQELLRSNADRRHPFRLMTLASLDVHSGYPQLRTVVKRHIDLDFNVLMYTDTRSPKVQQLKTNSKMSVLWYHPKKKLQVRMHCNAILVDVESALYNHHLSIVIQSYSVSDYTTISPPSSVIDDEKILHTDEVHFSLIRLVPSQIEVLQLNKEQHERVSYFHENGGWKETNLVP